MVPCTHLCLHPSGKQSSMVPPCNPAIPPPRPLQLVLAMSPPGRTALAWRLCKGQEPREGLESPPVPATGCGQRKEWPQRQDWLQELRPTCPNIVQLEKLQTLWAISAETSSNTESHCSPCPHFRMPESASEMQQDTTLGSALLLVKHVHLSVSEPPNLYRVPYLLEPSIIVCFPNSLLRMLS